MHGALEQAIELMRRNTDDPQSIREIADAIGMSPQYFSRLFTVTQGVGPLAYLRRLRLDQAAQVLLDQPHKPLVDVALDAGFESQQTFTRAFRAAYGVPPGRFRRSRTRKDLAMNTTPLPAIQLDWHVATVPPRRCAGIGVTIDGTGAATPASAWSQLMPHLPITGQLDGYSYGLCFPETAEGAYRYMAAVELPAGVSVPEGMEAVDLPRQDYLVARQFMPAAAFGDHLQAGLERLWTQVLSESGRTAANAPDLEVYPDSLVAYQTEGWLTHMIPLEPTA